MTIQEREQIERVCGKDFEILDIPTYIRDRGESEENQDEHIQAEILTDQEE